MDSNQTDTTFCYMTSPYITVHHKPHLLDYVNEAISWFISSQRLFTLTNISHTNFIRTTEQRHIETVQHFWVSGLLIKREINAYPT